MSTAAFEEYFQNTISHALRLSVSPTFLLAKLAQVEDSKHALEATVLSLQLRLQDLEQRLAKYKDEASFIASALRKQVAENQRIHGQLNEVSKRCVWLEEECSLYHNDREVFRGVAEEAEDRACCAEERCDEAEKQVEKILAEVDSLKTLQNEHAQQKEELEKAVSKVLNLEMTNANLQAELLKAEQKLASQLPLPSRESDTLAVSNRMEGCVYGTNSSDKKTDQSVVKERPGTHQLMAEVQRLWKEVALYKCNLARAEIQVRILDDDNKDLRAALRNRVSTAAATIASPVSKKGKTSCSLFEHTGIKRDTRQPLSQLKPNRLNLR